MRAMMKVLLVKATLIGTLITAADAQTLPQVLAQTYAYNPGLNASRAQLRATDETVTQARSTLRPQIGSTLSAEASRSRTNMGDRRETAGSRSGFLSSRIEVSQTLFDGLRTSNNVQATKARVMAARANLENDVQATLLDAATIYASVVRNRKVADLRRQNLEFLLELVRASRTRFEVGEATRTDVAQTEAQQALATATLNDSLAQVAESEAVYFRIVGDLPKNLQTPTLPAGATLPRSIKAALATADMEHPAIRAGQYAVQADSFTIASTEGALLPTVTARGSLDDSYSLSATSQTFDRERLSDLPGVNVPKVHTQNEVSGSVSLQVDVPIYQGGLASSRVREAKEVLGQRRIEAERLRSQVRANVSIRWAELAAAQGNVLGSSKQVSAAQVALSGVIEERAVGQRTTLNVLEAQADVISARIRLADAERDVVTAGYGLLYAIGRNSPERLDLNIRTYDPAAHYDAVHDKWYGTRTPDGR